ncbi:MAG: purine-binding chemotaxis protein CheW [Bacteroidales bacterium]|nr:purine-binding chemotaxis protein CheW [Bacteroidales bacterium]
MDEKTTTAKTMDDLNSYLVFQIGNELFSTNVGKVLEIQELVKITKVPKTPDYIIGVINLRGGVLPVIDSRIKFGMQPTEFTVNTCIIVMETNIDNNTVQVGSLVDSVHSVIEVEKEDILPPPGIGSKFQSEFINGMIKIDDKFIILLNIDKVFSSTELINIKDIMSKQKDNKVKKTEKKQ